MMNLIVMVLALICAVLAETVCPAANWMGQAKPPLVMCLVLYYAMCRPLPLMLGAVVFGGMLSDCLNAVFLGYSTICLAGVGLLARSYRDVVFSRRWFTHMLFGALAGMGMTLALYGLLWLADSGMRTVYPGWVLMKVMGVGVYGLVLAPIVFRLMERLDRMVGNIKMETVE